MRITVRMMCCVTPLCVFTPLPHGCSGHRCAWLCFLPFAALTEMAAGFSHCGGPLLIQRGIAAKEVAKSSCTLLAHSLPIAPAAGGHGPAGNDAAESHAERGGDVRMSGWLWWLAPVVVWLSSA